MGNHRLIIEAVLNHYPDVQAIYLFGSYDTEYQRPNSDVDIALLLPPEKIRETGSLALGPLWFELECRLGKAVDLIDLRQMPTVFRKEIIAADRRIYCGDEYAADEFEMLTLSFYQKLNQERREVLAKGLRSGRFHDV
ncbi:MAG TPA: nucleotidyltransferase domain-containing protein [Candidatus Competibacter sp.]|nr:nucleotidyltransferase domain-containing protein [Candidatus Competibacter sp.]